MTKGRWRNIVNKRVLFFSAIVFLTPLVSLAEDVKRYREGDVVWSCTVNHGGVTLTCGPGEAPAVSGDVPAILIVPERIRNHRVVGLGNFAFAHLGVEEIHLPKTLVTIAGKAFANNTQLRKVIFPESLKSIDSSRFTYGSFSGCSSLSELVFLGPPPTIANLGTSMHDIVRYTQKYKTVWEKYLYDNGIDGGALYEPSSPEGTLQVGKQEESKPIVSSAMRDNNPPASTDVRAQTQEKALPEIVNLIQLDVLPLTMGADTEFSPRVKNDILAFGTAVKTINEKAEKERVALDQKTKEILANEMTRAQQSGNLNLTLAIKKIIDDNDYNTPSDIPVVSRIQSIRRKRLMDINEKLLAEGVAAARILYGKVAEAKKVSTQNGQFDEAIALDAFQKNVLEWAKNLSNPTTIP